jgi:hypothetical protein
VPDLDIGTEDESLATRKDLERDKAVRIAIQILNSRSTDSKGNPKTAVPRVTVNNP